MTGELADMLATDNILYQDALPEVPPGMTGADVPIYRTWKLHPIPKPTKLFFNIRVGPSYDELQGRASADATITAQLLALRIDALAFDGTTWWIIEFHGNAGLPQYGRLTGYPHLLRATYQIDPPLRSIMICDTINPYTLPLFTASGIPVATYPAPGQPASLLNPGAL
jgi:hypothetical protein